MIFGEDRLHRACRGKGCAACDFTGLERRPPDAEPPPPPPPESDDPDQQAANGLRDAAIERVSGPRLDWLAVAWINLEDLARHRRSHIKPDTLWPLLRMRGVPPPSDERAMGALFMKAGGKKSKHRILEALGYVPGHAFKADGTRGHARPVREYRSLIFTGPEWPPYDDLP